MGKKQTNSSRKGITNQILFGDAVIERIQDANPALKPKAKNFIDVHRQFSTAEELVQRCDSKQKDALAEVNRLDAILDESVEDLANAVVSAKLGARINPFKELSSYAPSRLTQLAYATELVEVRKLVAAIGKKKPGAELKKACAACLKNAAAVEKALKALTGPQSNHASAMNKRDKLLVIWEKGLNTFKKHANVILDDEPEDYTALFAAPESVQVPRKRRAKAKRSKKPGSGNSGGATSPTPPADGASTDKS